MACASTPWSRFDIVVLALGLSIVAPGCGDDDEPGCEDASCPGEGGTVTNAGSDSGSDDGSSSAPGESSSGGDSSSTAPAESSSESGAPSDGRCDPSNAPFEAVPPALPQASIAFDFAAQSCAVSGLTSVPPQIVLDVEDSGLLTATLYGLEIVSTSSGIKFSESPQGDSQVIDFNPGVNMTFEATTIPGDVPVTIEFFVDTAGPALRDASAVFGG